MRPVGSLRLTVTVAAFCGGIVLGGWTDGVGAHAARTPHNLNAPTALWKAYPLDAAHSGARKQPAAATTTPAESHQPRVTPDRLAARSASSDAGLPIVLMTAGVFGALLVSLLMVVRQAAPARSSVSQDRRTGTTTTRRRASRTVRRKVRPQAAPPRRLTGIAREPKAVQAPPEPREGEIAAAAATEPGESEAADQMGEIRLWRGYVKCQLYVAVEGADGALLESRLFRLRNPMAPDEVAQEVLADLLADLDRAGWSVVESGPGWYRRRLQRREPPF